MQKLSVYNLPEVWKIFAEARKCKNHIPLTQIIGHTCQTVAVGSWKVTSDECLSFSDRSDTRQNVLRPKRGLLLRRLLIHKLKNLAHCVGLGGLKYVIHTMFGKWNGLNFTESESLTACILTLQNTVRKNSIDRNSETMLDSNANKLQQEVH